MQKGKVYPDIHSLHIENFMGIKDSTITFSDNFVNLKGMNSRGKSATNKAFRVIMTNYKANKQRKWIKWGEQFFRLTLTFVNGISVVYEKRKNGKSKYEIYNERDEVIFTTFKDGVYAPIVEIPEPVQALIGVIKQGSMTPNFMKSREPLFIVDTTGKTNDEYLRGTLEPEDVSKAQELIKNDIDAKRHALKETISSVTAYKNILTESPLVDERVINHLESKDATLNDFLSISDNLKSVEDLNTMVKSILVLPELELVPSEKIKIVEELGKILQEWVHYNSLINLPEVKKVSDKDLNLLNTLRVLSDLMQTYNEAVILPDVSTVEEYKIDILKNSSHIEECYDKYVNLTVIPHQNLVDVKLLELIVQIEKLVSASDHTVLPELKLEPINTAVGVLDTLEDYEKVYESYKKSESDMLEVHTELDDLMSKLKQQNLIVVKCNECGHLSILDKEGNSLTDEDSHLLVKEDVK